MDAGKKSLQIQSQVRHNAEGFKNTLNDLYSWEKEIKVKEQELQRKPPPATVKLADVAELALPIRSHTGKATAKKLSESSVGRAPTAPSKEELKVETPTEKVEMPIDANEEKRKQANIIKERGNQHVKASEYVKAIDEYTAAIDVFPEDVAFYNNRAFCYLKLKKYYECIEDCERAIEIDKQSVKAYYRRMLANESLGNDFNALEDCTKILLFDPKNGEAKKSLARINESLRGNFKSISGPNFSAVRSDMCFIYPTEKAPHERSKKPLVRVPITDVVGPKDSKNHENTNIQVSDEVIDKLFNSDCGPFVEVKKEAQEKPLITAPTKKELINSETNTTAKEMANAATTTLTKETKTNKQPASKQAAVKIHEKTPSEAEAKKSKQAVAKETSKEENIDSNKISNAVKKEPVQAFNQHIDIIKSAPYQERPLPPVPTSTAQFYSNWKELSPAQKYQYMKSIEVARLCKILGAGFDSDTLTDVISTMRDFYIPNNEPSLAATLLEVSKNNQVTILSLLMSTDDRKAITEILNSIKENKADISIAEVVTKNFNLQ